MWCSVETLETPVHIVPSLDELSATSVLTIDKVMPPASNLASSLFDKGGMHSEVFMFLNG